MRAIEMIRNPQAAAAELEVFLISAAQRAQEALREQQRAVVLLAPAQCD
jgi:hypothetical protein